MLSVYISLLSGVGSWIRRPRGSRREGYRGSLVASAHFITQLPPAFKIKLSACRKLDAAKSRAARCRDGTVRPDGGARFNFGRGLLDEDERQRSLPLSPASGGARRRGLRAGRGVEPDLHGRQRLFHCSLRVG